MAPGDRKFWHIEGIKAEVLARQPGKNGTTTKLQLITPTERGLEETTIALPDTVPAERSVLAAALLNTFLTQFNIVEPNRSKIIKQHPPCSSVVAWCLYTLSQPGLSENRAGYVYNRLRNRNAPPPDFIRLAGLSPPEWRECHRAMRYRDVEMLSADLQAAIAPLSEVWETLTIELGARPKDAPAQEQKAESVLAQGSDTRELPAQIVELLQGRDRVKRLGDRWVLTTRDLYRGCVLARTTAQWEMPSVITVQIEGQRGIEYDLNPEILAFTVEALDDSAWLSIQEELRMTMTRSVFSLWWRDVLPLGLAGNRVILGTPSALAGEWIASHQLKGVERTCSGVLGRPMQVEFVTFAIGADEPSPMPMW
jgi:hypothetical protein